jgi:hypothetical protein
VLNTIRNMKADGYTHVAEGVGWGLRVLSPGEPFTEGVSYDNNEITKAMVLLTDGENTFESENNHNGSTYTAYGFLDQAGLARQLLDRSQCAEQPAARCLQQREGRGHRGVLVCLQRAECNAARADQVVCIEPGEVLRPAVERGTGAQLPADRGRTAQAAPEPVTGTGQVKPRRTRQNRKTRKTVTRFARFLLPSRGSWSKANLTVPEGMIGHQMPSGKARSGVSWCAQALSLAISANGNWSAAVS